MICRFTPARRTCAPIIRIRAAPRSRARATRDASSSSCGCSYANGDASSGIQCSACRSWMRSASGLTINRERSNSAYLLLILFLLRLLHEFKNVVVVDGTVRKKTVDGILLIVKNFEHHFQLGKLRRVHMLRAEIQQFQRTAGSGNLGVAEEQCLRSFRIDLGHSREVKDHLKRLLVCQRDNR